MYGISAYFHCQNCRIVAARYCGQAELAKLVPALSDNLGGHHIDKSDLDIR
jgi:hypothetical protein